ncbi:hypothetical protein [Pseudoteredinibacter isoporae]|uniref:hypothetical protein n=1 Tax=Pseudoteredinibacter isoporae TaxID=570281 RepID=UPI003106EF77
MQKILTRVNPDYPGRFQRRLRLGAIHLFLALLCIVSTAAYSDHGIAVIANQQVDAASLSPTRLKSIFGMRTTTWKNGQPIRVFVLKDNDPLHVRFTKDVLQTYPYNLRRIWERRVYSGTGLAPTVVNTEGEMLKLIAETENAIGYIQHHNIDQNVKVLEIR